MKYKKIYLLVCLLICVLSMASVCASEVNDTAVTATDVENNLEINNDNVGVDDVDNSSSDFKEDDLGISAPNSDSDKINSTDNDVVGSAGSENLDDNNDEIDIVGTDDDSKVNNDGENVLGEDQIGDFNILQNLINDAGEGGVVTLTRNYTFTIGLDENLIGGITLKRGMTINGNGYSIDALGKSIIFYNRGSTDNVTLNNITFKNANREGDGGAIYLRGKDVSVVGCSFVNCSATGNGGAIYLYGNGVVSGCNFTGNSADGDGGAIFHYGVSSRDCSVVGCSFMNCSAGVAGGAIYLIYGFVSGCNFTGNSADGDGGAIYHVKAYNNMGVSDCSFVGNSVSGKGSAIFFNYENYVSDCSFVDNRVIRSIDHDNCNVLVFTIVDGENNYVDAIYSEKSISFNNVNYYYNGIRVNSNDVPIVESDHVANLTHVNIVVEVYSEDALVDNVTLITDSYASVYYSYSKFPDGDYTYKAYNMGEEYLNYVPAKGNITRTQILGDFNSLQELILMASEGDVINLTRNYTFTPGFDESLSEGIVVCKNNLTINGNGYTIDALGKSRIFNVTLEEVKLNDIVFINANYSGNGGAIYWYGRYGVVSGCGFVNCSAASDGGAIYWYGRYGVVSGCNFTCNSVVSNGGAIYWYGWYGVVSGCGFVNCSAKYGGVITYRGNDGVVSGCGFVNCSAKYGGVITYRGYGGVVSGCGFVNCSATIFGGAIYYPGDSGVVSGCGFVNCSAASDGGAIFYSGDSGVVSGCGFVNCSAKYGGAIFYSGDSGVVSGCGFVNCSAGVYGSAIFSDYDFNISNSSFMCKISSTALNVVDENCYLILTFEGNANYTNAIEMDSCNVTFSNLTYWNGQWVNSDNLNPSLNASVVGQDIVIEVYSANTLVDNVTLVADESGQLVYDYINLPAGVYTYIAYHPDNEYYGYANVTGSFNVSSPFDSLNKKISYADNNITLKKDYVYDSENDTAFAGGILIDKNMTVYGNGHCIDAKGLARIFNVTEGVTLTLVNVTLKNGRADNGGAIYSKGTLVILNSTLKGNHATEQGGAICSNGNLTIADSLIDDNGGKWGAVCVVGTGSIVNSTLSNNNGDVGGAVYNLFANLTISGSNITDNYANTVGAGVYSFGGNVEINSSTLKGNNAPSGSAVWTVYGSGVILNDVRLVDNAGESLTSDDGVAIDTTRVKFLTAVSFRIEDINDTLKGSEITINITELNKGKEFSGNVTVFIGDENYTVEIINGTGIKKVIPNLSLGIYAVRLIFNETDVYDSASSEGNPFHIRAKPEIVIADISNVDEGTPVTIKVTAVESFNGDFIIVIGGANYTVSMVNGSGEKTLTLSPGTYNATISFPGNDFYTAGDALSNVFIVKKKPVNINTVKVALSKNTFTYNAKVQKPTVTISNGVILKEGVDYTLQWSAASPKNAGTYTITVTGIGAYTGTKQVTFKINKAANPLKVKAKTVKVKFSKLIKKAQKLKVTKVVKFTKKGQGTLTYKKVSGNKKITINKKTGKVIIKKGLKKGNYKVKVKIKANGNANYKASAFKTVTFKIKVQ